MKKSLVVTLALVFVLGIAGTAFANPYSDVPAGHWAYKAVNDLSKAGIVEGYQGKYRGNDNMTRYEMAAITARAMAKADKADADTKATIDKLAVEFSKELNDLGVRVAALEKKAGNVTLGGNVRLRYESFDYDSDKLKDDTQKLRVRLDVNGQINEDWRVFARLESTEDFLKSGNEGLGSGAVKDDKASLGTVEFDQLFVQGKLGATQLTVGRQAYVPVYGMVADSHFEGAKVAFNLGAVKTNVFYGRQEKVDFALKGLNDPTVAGAEVGFDLLKNLEAKAAYYYFDSSAANSQERKIAEAGLGYKIGSSWKLLGTYAESNAAIQDSAMAFNLKYKGVNTKVAGTWGAWAQYADLENNALVETTYAYDDFKGYEVGFEYVPFKNSKWTTLYWDGEENLNSNFDKQGFRTQLEVFF